MFQSVEVHRLHLSAVPLTVDSQQRAHRFALSTDHAGVLGIFDHPLAVQLVHSPNSCARSSSKRSVHLGTRGGISRDEADSVTRRLPTRGKSHRFQRRPTNASETRVERCNRKRAAGGPDHQSPRDRLLLGHRRSFSSPRIPPLHDQQQPEQRGCDAASPATRVLKIETQDLVDDLANGDVSKSRFLRSDDATGVDDVGTNDAENEERVSLKGLLGVIKQKMTSATMPLDLNTAIIPEKVKADFSKLYIKKMKENDTFKMNMFEKWDVYTVEEIMPKMKSIPKRDGALVSEY
ncbi:uncharacterized protein IUM83_04645 [Phytophthora cinnamomi]|uniref:uncharacterized protein n=1 Tax=Phytophthora cinnamomi TaxID=4785 RepID=UPI003559D4B1|nr:hypothetical protein IUM83_04645 [Phytophthora cinnamomi]